MAIPRTSVQTALTGAAGEHYVIGALLRRGVLAAAAPPGTSEVDLLIVDRSGSVSATVQVKTRLRGSSGWSMSSKHERVEGSGLFYAFVDWIDPMLPRSWIVPSAMVADYVRTSHASWLESPGRQGQPHNETDMRRLEDRPQSFPLPERFMPGWMDRFSEAWHLLGG